MSNIIRWNPYREMMILRNAMDRLVDSNNIPGSANNQPKTWGLALDVSESDDEFLVQASLPGVNPEDVDITFESDVLTIKADVHADVEEEDNERRYYMRERRFGSFCRSLTLPSTIDAEAIEANYEAGILSLHLPKAEETKPKRIEVKSINGK